LWGEEGCGMSIRVYVNDDSCTRMHQEKYEYWAKRVCLHGWPELKCIRVYAFT
jgi:hypothetical protein